MARLIRHRGIGFWTLGVAAVCMTAASVAAEEAAGVQGGFIAQAPLTLDQAYHSLDRAAALLQPAPGELMRLRGDEAEGSLLSVGMGSAASTYIGAGGLGQGLGLKHGAASAASLGAAPAFSQPYLFLGAHSRHAGISRELGDFRIKYVFLRSGLSHSMSVHAFNPDSLSPALITVQPRIDARVLELSHAADDAAYSVSLMRSKERYSMPGLPRTVTAFGMGAPTSSAQLTGVWLLAPKVALAAQASYGRTPAGAAGTVRSNAFSLGMVASDRQVTGDRLSLTVSQPIRPYRGNWSGQPVVPDGREMLAELNYVAPMGALAYGGWAVSVRRHPDNVSAAAPEKLLALRYVQQF